ncbi:MAG: hypothetical protein INH41_10575 [Myxococcaceae bacterium]|jgi:hypothetical protein|nr:hypothetical protein [Myxococcaceae bacterium]MCA3012829.1 hypothetical protein [Myxococcaceae bacterium]
MPPAFEAELLAFVLDGDTVQNLVVAATARWGLTADEVVRFVAEAHAQGLLRLSLDDGAVASRDVPGAELSRALLDAHSYLWLERTPRTLERLDELAATPGRPRSAPDGA